jgi:hypothetical protein
MPTQQMTQAQAQQQAIANNAAARQLVSARGLRMVQAVFSQTFTPSSNPVINVIPRNVGLIMGFWVKVTASIHNTTGGGTAITPTQFGVANLISNFQYTDLNNLVRINTPGWHINFLNSIKGRWPYAMSLLNTALDGINVTGAYGSNWPVISQSASIADTVTTAVTMWYYVPLAYSDGDYRGAVFANVVNATQQLQITFNPNPVVASTTDTTNAVYTAVGAAGSMTSATVTVYQDYVDQLPQGPQGYILPQLDLSTIYELKFTTVSSIVANNDFPVQYPNFRDFLSTFAIFNHDPSVGTGRGVGADVNYFALQAANLTNVFKLEPNLVALRTRALLHCDFPDGVYYFGHRAKPIATTQYGNMQLVLNASTANTGAYMLIGWEDFGLQNVITQAGSLPAS